MDSLSKGFKAIFNDEQTCDVKLKVKEQVYMAHKTVLSKKSAVFASIFKHDSLGPKSWLINISDCDNVSFAFFLEFVYLGKLEKLSFSSAMNLYYTSKKYDVQPLNTLCLNYLMLSVDIRNVCEIVSFADKYRETTLFSTAQKFFNQHIDEILKSDEFDRFLITNRRLATRLLIAMPKVIVG